MYRVWIHLVYEPIDNKWHDQLNFKTIFSCKTEILMRFAHFWWCFSPIVSITFKTERHFPLLFLTYPIYLHPFFVFQSAKLTISANIINKLQVPKPPCHPFQYTFSSRHCPIFHQQVTLWLIKLNPSSRELIYCKEPNCDPKSFSFTYFLDDSTGSSMPQYFRLGESNPHPRCRMPRALLIELRRQSMVWGVMKYGRVFYSILSDHNSCFYV